MERSPICPNCLSKFAEIHGMLYRNGNPVGERCENTWHLGAEYNPDRWVLSAFDEEFLEEQHISTR
jgi:hypothetical protein